MSVDECKIVPQIVQGERKELTVTLLNAKTGEAIDLSAVDEIQSVHEKNDNTSGDYLTKKLEKAGVAEITTIQALADVSSNLASKYIKINSPSSQYAFYFVVGSQGSAPSLSNTFIVAVNINENDTAVDVAEALRAQIDAQADFSASRATDVVTVTNANQGEVVDPTDVGTGFTINVTTQGVTEVLDSIEVVGTGQFKIKLSTDETKSLKEGLRQTFHVAVDFQDTAIGRKIYKLVDAYDVCETDFSLD